MPSFFTNSSGVQLPMNVQTPMEAARVLQYTWGGGSTAVPDTSKMANGMLFTVPNPLPLVLADGRPVEEVVQEAVLAAKEQGVRGAKITPFLLQRIEKLTAGQSLESNIALIVNNAKTAAEIAGAYAELRGGDCFVPTSSVVDSAVALKHPDDSATKLTGSIKDADVVVIGGAVVDYVAYSKKSAVEDGSAGVDPARFIPGSSNPGTMKISYGGVGRNIAEAIGRLGGCKVALLSSVGADISGQGLLAHAKEQCNIDVAEVAITGGGGASDADSAAGTASYTAIHNGTSGDLIVGIADMDIFHEDISPEYVTRSLAGPLFPPVSDGSTDGRRRSLLLATDGNLSVASFKAVTKLAAMASNRSFNPVDVTLFFDGTSDVKCTLPLLATSMHHVDIIKPNVGELVELVTMLINFNMVPVNSKTVGNILLALRQRRDSSGDVKEGHFQPDSDSFWSIDEVRCLAVALYEAMMYLPSPAILSLRNKNSGSSVDDVEVDRIVKESLLGADIPACYSSSATADSLEPRFANSSASASTIPKHAKPKHVLVTLGPLGVLWISSSTHVLREHVKLSKDVKTGVVPASVAKGITVIEVDDNVSALHIPSCSINQWEIINTSGAGDTFCGTLLHSVSAGGAGSASLSENVSIANILYALRGAKASLMSKTAIPVDLKQMLEETSEVK